MPHIVIMYYNSRLFFIAFALLFLFTVTIRYIQHVSKDCPLWASKISYLPILVPSNKNPSTSARLVQTYFQDIVGRHPEVEVIFTPESSFYAHEMFVDPMCCRMWNTQQLGKSVTLVAGTFRWDNSAYRNCCYYIHDGQMQGVFDKRSALPFTERIPKWCSLIGLRHLTLGDGPEITPSRNQRPLWKISKELCVVPYLCSELFLQLWPEDQHYDHPILALVCDRWFPKIMRMTMLAIARFQSFLWNRIIIYVSFSYGRILMPNWTMVEIKA